MKRCMTILALLAAGCGPSASTESGSSTFAGAAPIDGIEDRRVRVVTTTNFVSDLVEEVGGERVDVHGLMGAGVDPHQYKASAGDVGAIADADAVFYVGLHLEAKMGDVLAMTARDRLVVALGDGLDESELLAPTGTMSAGGAEHDPHVWFDTDLWSQTPEIVADALSTIDPEHADDYHERADRYRADVVEAGERAEELLGGIPERRRVLVTSHDAFRYLGRRFDVEVEAIQGISTVAEATTSDIQRIADLIVERDVGAVFVESSVPRRTIEAVVAAAAEQGVTVDIGNELYSDAAGSAGTPQETWRGMFDHNVDSIVEGLA